MRTKDINTQSHWNNKWLQEGKDTWRKYINCSNKELEWIDNKKSVIDLGCGNGYFLNKVKQERVNMVLMGLDISPIAIKQLNDFYGIDGIVSKLPEISLPIADEMFDYVVMNEIMEHVEDEKSLMFNAFRICKKDGYVIVTVPSDHTENYKKFIEEKDSEHVRWYDEEKLRNSLIMYGQEPEILEITETHQRNGMAPVGNYYVARNKK